MDSISISQRLFRAAICCLAPLISAAALAAGPVEFTAADAQTALDDLLNNLTEEEVLAIVDGYEPEGEAADTWREALLEEILGTEDADGNKAGIEALWNELKEDVNNVELPEKVGADKAAKASEEGEE